MKSSGFQSGANDSSSRVNQSTNNHSGGTGTHNQTKMLGTIVNEPSEEEEDEESELMSLESTIDVASIDIFSLARHGRF